MDVDRLRSRASLRFTACLIVSAMGLSGCLESNDVASTSGGQNKPFDLCASDAIAGSYLVKWRDGSITREDAENHDAFVRDVLEPNHAEIEYTEINRRVRLTPPHTVQAESTTVAPLPSWGQDITRAADAWAAGENGNGVIVAVVDTGADITHPQLRDQLAANAGEQGVDAHGANKSTNGIDDDSNGYIDDVFGYDFAHASPITSTRPGHGDDNGHGTHVAGIILAEHTAGPVLGIAPHAQLLPLKFLESDGSGDLANAIESIEYAVSRGARVINASWGGSGCSRALKEEIAGLEARGVLFITAAGNNGDGTQAQGLSLESVPVFPAALGLHGQIVVGSSNSQDYMSGFSNFSWTLVDLVAPGSLIFSTYPGGSTRTLNGTSMATPFVSGAAAVLLGAHPTATVAQIKEALVSSVDRGNFAVSSRGRLNLSAALASMSSLH